MGTLSIAVLLCGRVILIDKTSYSWVILFTSWYFSFLDAGDGVAIIPFLPLEKGYSICNKIPCSGIHIVTYDILLALSCLLLSYFIPIFGLNIFCGHQRFFLRHLIMLDAMVLQENLVERICQRLQSFFPHLRL